jgi:hypothetical protein
VDYLDDLEANVRDLNGDITDVKELLIDELGDVVAAPFVVLLDDISDSINETESIASASGLEGWLQPTGSEAHGWMVAEGLLVCSPCADFESDFSEDVNKYDNTRSRFFRATLGILCAFVILTVRRGRAIPGARLSRGERRESETGNGGEGKGASGWTHPLR